MENQYVVSISHAAVGGLLNSNELKPHLSKYWCIPKQNDAAFVANMEDVLGIYQLPYRREAPVVCMDEKPLQLPKPGYCEKIDSEYVRCGTAGIFMFTEPLGGRRHVTAPEHRTKGDYAKMMRRIAEKYYADSDRIILVSDNLNTHNKASFYEAFSPETAYKLSRKYEMHYTPKHGSWLNIAETEPGSLTIQCLGNRRIDTIGELNSILSAWERDRNQKQIGVNWQFTAEDAGIKLKRLYPTPIFDE